jgi:hypothetical protein
MSDAAESGVLRPAALQFRELEDRLRFAYLRTLPPPLLSRVDPPLRALAAALRRAAAVPLYLRQELKEWTGTLEARPLRIRTWGHTAALRMLLPLLFDDEPSATSTGRCSLPELLREPQRPVVAVTTPVLAPLLRRAGYWIVPGLVRQGASLEALDAVRKRPSKGIKNDRRWIEGEGLQVEPRSYSPELSRFFYESYLVPHVRRRFAGSEEPTSFAAVDRQFAAGFALAVVHPDCSEPDAFSISYIRGDTLFWSKAAVRDGNPELVRRRAIAALEFALPLYARERGLRAIDAGRALPWRGNGVTWNKWKWGYRPILDPNQTLEFAVRAMGDGADRIQRRLAEQQLIVRTGSSFRVLTTAGPKRPDERLPAPGAERAS